MFYYYYLKIFQPGKEMKRNRLSFLREYRCQELVKGLIVIVHFVDPLNRILRPQDEQSADSLPGLLSGFISQRSPEGLCINCKRVAIAMGEYFSFDKTNFNAVSMLL